MKNYRLSLPFLGLLLALSPLRAQEAAVQQETSEQKDKRMEWFSQAGYFHSLGNLCRQRSFRKLVVL